MGRPSTAVAGEGPSLQRREQLADGLPADRIPQVRCDFRQRLEHEAPLAESRMRHDQPGLVDHGLPKQDQIQIERPRRVRGRPLPPTLALDPEQGVQQRPRRQRRLPDGGGVQIQRLRPGDAGGDRVVVGGDGELAEKRSEAATA